MKTQVGNQNIRLLFKIETDDKEYVVYLNDNNEISASILVMNGKVAELKEITDDEEWNYVESMIEKRLSNE